MSAASDDKDKFKEVDEEYVNRMIAFELDCNDGKGAPMPCHQVGEFWSVVKGDHKRAAAVYEQNCNQNGYAASCFNLARFYMNGRGVAVDEPKAENLFDKACKGGHLYSCYNFGTFQYLTAIGELEDTKTKTILDPKSAAAIERKAIGIRALQKACEGDEVDSCYFLANHFIRKGNVTDRNPALASTYYDKCCDRNHAPSCHNLAVLYKNGDTGVPADKDLFEKYKNKTKSLIASTGLGKGRKVA